MARSSLAARLVGWAVAGTIGLAGSGCAHQSAQHQEASAAQQRVQKLQSRVEELERTNGRLMVRLDEMEDDVFLLQDRVEAHRLALRRRGRMGDPDQRGRAQRTQVIRAPQPSPETQYGRRGRQQYRGNQQQQYRRPQGNRPQARTRRIDVPSNTGDAQRRGNQNADTRTRSPRDQRPQPQNNAQARTENGSGADGEHETAGRETERKAEGKNGGDSDSVVITEEDFKRFAKRMEQGERSNGSDNSEPARSGSSGRKRAKERVTEERLATSDELDRKKAPSGSNASEKRRPRPTKTVDNEALDGKTGLDLYKAALAKYRAGQYTTALRGFKAFMAENPQRDYLDNGMYWIGECYFGLGKYQRAVDYFQRVLQEQPHGNKVPDAMLKMALAHRELGNAEKTRSLLEKLTQRYPTTNAGQLGKKKLSDLKS